MNIQLIQGTFPSSDALFIIEQLIKVKISFHEQRISASDNEEDVKHRESRIKALQKELEAVRNEMLVNPLAVTITAEINTD